MKKMLILLAILLVSGIGYSQSAAQKPGCDKTACGPEGTKKGEAVAITTLRSDLQKVMTSLAQSGLGFNAELVEATISKGTSDDESLLFISQYATAIRLEMIEKLKPSTVMPEMKSYHPTMASSKQQLMTALKQEVQLLANQLNAL